MKSEKQFVNFIDKVGCAIKQLTARGLTPVMTHHWNLVVSRSTKIVSINPTIPPLTQVHALSPLMEGVTLNTRLFGVRPDNNYNGCMTSFYPYIQMERMFLFPPDTLKGGFLEGFQNKPTYKNNYANNKDFKPELGIAFDVGRFLMYKHFGISLPFKHQPFFK